MFCEMEAWSYVLNYFKMQTIHRFSQTFPLELRSNSDLKFALIAYYFFILTSIP